LSVSSFDAVHIERNYFLNNSPTIPHDYETPKVALIAAIGTTHVNSMYKMSI